MQNSSKFYSRRAAVGVVALVALAFLVFNGASMLRRGPYPTHPDEAFIVNHAWNIVKTGDLNPHFFNYGSLPIYLTSASLGAAAAVAKVRGKITSLDQAEPISYPYYRHPSISYAPRFVFAFVASLALFAVGLIALSLRPSYATTLVSVVVLAFYPLFQRHAWSYINTDILVSTLATGALAFLSRTLDSDRMRERVLVPALFCGCTLATKYNAGLLLLPFALAIVMRSSCRRALLQLACLSGATTLIFLICMPFALYDFENFSADVLWELNHYRNGHPRNEGEPGFPMLTFHLRRIRAGLGWVASGLILLGVGYGAATDRKRTLLLASFPVASIAFMSAQRVNFPRNLLPAAACLIAFAGLGLMPIQGFFQRSFVWAGSKWPRFSQSAPAAHWFASLATAFVLLAILYKFPSARTRGGLALVDPDSRKEITDWLLASAPSQHCHVIVAEEVALNPADIAHHCTVATFDVSEEIAPETLAQQLTQIPGDRPDRTIYFALPRWKEEAAPLNALAELLGLGPPLFEAGYRGLTYARERHHGDPKISLYAFAPKTPLR